MKKHYYIIFGFLLFNINSLSAQIRHYDITLFGELIGEITTQKKVFSENEYELSYASKAEAEILFTTTKTYVMAKILYKNNFVNDGYVIIKKNKETKELYCKWDGSKYQISENGNNSIEYGEMYYCTTNFFFKEPINHHKVFVERLKKYVPIEHKGNHQYLTKVDGGTNLYTYKNGILQSLVSKKGISVYMKLRS